MSAGHNPTLRALSPPARATVLDEQQRRQSWATWSIAVDGLWATTHPPQDWRLMQEGADGRAWRLAAGGHMTVIESVSREADGRRWHHVSVARRDRDPTWLELVAVKEAFIGSERYAYLVAPPRDRYVSLHQHCLHWFSCLDAPAGAVLPEFSAAGQSL